MCGYSLFLALLFMIDIRSGSHLQDRVVLQLKCALVVFHGLPLGQHDTIAVGQLLPDHHTNVDDEQQSSRVFGVPFGERTSTARASAQHSTPLAHAAHRHHRHGLVVEEATA